MRCAVVGCGHNNKKKCNLWNFYRFPQDEELCKKWLQFCRREGSNNSKHLRVCNLHFKPEDFGLSVRSKFKLKESACPRLINVETQTERNPDVIAYNAECHLHKVHPDIEKGLQYAMDSKTCVHSLKLKKGACPSLICEATQTDWTSVIPEDVYVDVEELELDAESESGESPSCVKTLTCSPKIKRRCKRNTTQYISTMLLSKKENISITERQAKLPVIGGADKIVVKNEAYKDDKSVSFEPDLSLVKIEEGQCEVILEVPKTTLASDLSSIKNERDYEPLCLQPDISIIKSECFL